MKWIVRDTLLCPQTGTAFSVVAAFRNIRLTIWHEANIFMPSGGYIEPKNTGILVNGHYNAITIYNVTAYNEDFWSSLRGKLLCPKTVDKKSGKCDYPYHCAVKLCPYK